jgi:adiponectin receptor
MLKISETEEKIQNRDRNMMKSHESKEEKHLPEECHSPECHHNLKSKIMNYIGSFAQAPDFLQDNRFILHGYRINYDTPKKIFKRSVFLTLNFFDFLHLKSLYSA